MAAEMSSAKEPPAEPSLKELQLPGARGLSRMPLGSKGFLAAGLSSIRKAKQG